MKLIFIQSDILRREPELTAIWFAVSHACSTGASICCLKVANHFDKTPPGLLSILNR